MFNAFCLDNISIYCKLGFEGEKGAIIRRPIIPILFIVLAISLFRVQFNKNTESPLMQMDGKVTRIEGIVSNVKIKDNYAALTVKTESEKVLVRLSGSFTDDAEQMKKVYDLIGRRLVCTGKISIPESRRNPGEFDYRRYLRSKNIFTICEVSRFKISGESVKLHMLNMLSRKKAEFYVLVKPHLSDESFGLMAGLMFGESDYMDEDSLDAFRSNGLAHLLAVSGLHINFMYALLGKIFKKKTAEADLASALLVTMYCALSNFSPSSLRAASMIFMKIIAGRFHLRYDALSAASLSAVIFLITNPFRLFDCGMQLSFCAAYTMAIVSPWIEVKLGKLADRLKSSIFFDTADVFSSSLAAVLGTLPLTAYHFLKFNPFSLVLNPLAIDLAAIALPLFIGAFAAFLVLPSIAFSLLIPLLKIIAETAFGFFSSISAMGSLLWPNAECMAPPTGLIIMYYILFFFFFSESRHLMHRKNRHFELAVTECFLVFLGSYGPMALGYTQSLNPFSYGVASVSFLDVGQGDCIHIHDGNFDMLIDGGGSYYSNIAEKTLKPYLLRNGIKDIDLAIITHDDLDHAKGIRELSEIYEIKKIITNEDVYGSSGLDENEKCIVSAIRIEDLSFLFMADADIKREEYLLRRYGTFSCDVIKIGHHGSGGSSGESFLKTLKPSFAVISCGKNNNYGHPAERVLELLEELDIPYARTDRDGAICLRKISKDHFVFENASKTQRWIIEK